jgi:hypothetical protein
MDDDVNFKPVLVLAFDARALTAALKHARKPGAWLL